jgi:hypothetical protein
MSRKAMHTNKRKQNQDNEKHLDSFELFGNDDFDYVIKASPYKDSNESPIKKESLAKINQLFGNEPFLTPGHGVDMKEHLMLKKEDLELKKILQVRKQNVKRRKTLKGGKKSKRKSFKRNRKIESKKI